ncbi:MAG TPA: hypothetical protein DDZ80_27060, partial [Cyanobacteria bacterium UBA8803]|nr:hypothetical protein [Cyanobacteria bacterium UBA8803]
MCRDPGSELILKIFAARAAAELERQQTELALRLATERLQYLLRYSPAVIFSCKAGPDYGYTFISENVMAILGCQAREFIENADFWVSKIHPEDIEGVFAELPNLVEKKYHSHEYRFLHQDGKYRWLYEQLRLVEDGAGNPIECVGYWVDISDRKQAEEKLRLSEKRYRELFEGSVDGIAFVDLQDRFVDCNASYQKMLGYSLDELQQKQYSEITPVKWQAREVEIIHKQVLVRGYSDTYEKEYIRKDGTVFPVEIRSYCLKNEAGLTEMMWAIVRDISDRKQTEAALRQALEDAEVANHAKSQFLANMSHELRTPLNAILGFTQVMHRDTQISKTQQDYLNIILRSGEHLLDLINDILEMSKIEAGQMTFNETSFDLYRLLESLEEMLQIKARSKGLHLIFDRTQDVPQYVQTDE